MTGLTMFTKITSDGEYTFANSNFIGKTVIMKYNSGTSSYSLHQ